MLNFILISDEENSKENNNEKHKSSRDNGNVQYINFGEDDQMVRL